MTSPGDAVLFADGLAKSYGPTRALVDVGFSAAAGEVLGLLGPNGSGKTTTVRILTTLVPPDGGRATVDGHDVVREPHEVRTVIGLAGQYAAVDEYLTGRENLRLVAGLYKLSRDEADARADELLDLFDLDHAADRVANTYSGGMRRRLDLAASLVNRPKVLFLDEPTTGLDPPSRIVMWEAVRALARSGTTVLLTTQYLEEADQLCNSLVVVDRGSVIASGTPDQLKARIGGDVIALTVASRAEARRAAATLVPLAVGAASVDESNGQVTVPVGGNGAERLGDAVRLLDDAHVVVTDLGVRRPSLDEVFVALTGEHGWRDDRDDEAAEDAGHRWSEAAP